MGGTTVRYNITLDYMYDVFAYVQYKTSLVIDEMHSTGIYLPEDHGIVSMLWLVLTDLVTEISSGTSDHGHKLCIFMIRDCFLNCTRSLLPFPSPTNNHACLSFLLRSSHHKFFNT